MSILAPRGADERVCRDSLSSESPRREMELRDARTVGVRHDSQSDEQPRALIDPELSAGPDGLELVDLDHLLRIALQRLAGPAAARGIGLTVEAFSEPVWARASRSALELLFRQLLRIAVRQTGSGSRIAARLRRSEECLWVELRSDMPWQPKVGEFRVCQEIVRRHRGQLFVKEGRDVLVEIRFPRDTIAA